MHALVDPFDPRHWPLDPSHEFRIYGDDNAQSYAVVDEIDYHFLVQWKWSWDSPSMRNGKPRCAPRLRRNLQITFERAEYNVGGHYVNPETGRSVRLRHPRRQQTVRLHQVVMLRTGIVPTTKNHELVDHLDGDENNCRRGNLRWATHSMNCLNINGSVLMELGL